MYFILLLNYIVLLKNIKIKINFNAGEYKIVGDFFN